MPYDENDDRIIRHGTLKHLLNYQLEGTPIKAWHIVVAAFLAGLVAGALF